MSAMRLDRYLSHLQLGSRKATKQIVRAGRVRVDDALVRDPAFDVAPNAVVTVDGAVVGGDLVVYYLLNKPAGVVTANADPQFKTVLDLIDAKDLRPGLYPVGRLDRDTTGLLLLTNDGTLGHALLAPSRHVPKTYRVQLRAPLTAEMREPLETGIAFKEFTSGPAQVVVPDSFVQDVVELTIHEGKFHQVKRMFKAVGNEVVKLERIAMGPLRLPTDLAAGEYRPLTADELAAVKALVQPRKR